MKNRLTNVDANDHILNNPNEHPMSGICSVVSRGQVVSLLNEFDK